MRRNISGLTRIALIMSGAMILGLYGALASPWKYITLLGLLPLGSGLTGFCPMYAALDRVRRTRTNDATRTVF
jgi:hypothetical protein